jgi:hypothetical protein
VRGFHVRYLNGRKPWIYFKVQVIDGNGNAVNRAWNNYGNYVDYDGAGRDVDNTMNLYPPSSYSPVFGSSKTVNFKIYGQEEDVAYFGGEYSYECHTGPFYVQMYHL